MCISSFSNRRFGEKDPPSTAEDLIRDSLDNYNRVQGNPILFLNKTVHFLNRCDILNRVIYMASRYKFSEEEIKIIERVCRDNKDKRA